MLSGLRYGFRQLRLNPGFAALAIVTLALGIGANTALFSVVRIVLLKPLPYKNPERLARVWMDNRRLNMREDWASYLNYQDYKRLGTSFESMAALTEPDVNITSDGEPERVRGTYSEAALFDVLGVAPLQGRLFTKDEEAPGKGNVVLIGWRLWQRRFGGGDILGKQLDFDGRRFTVVGVMPAGFAFPAAKSEFWAPLVVTDQQKQRVGYWIQMVARIKPGISHAQAQAEMDVVGKTIEQQYPDANAGYGVFVNPLENHIAGNLRTPLLVLFGAVGLVLLIACVNVAGLFLARAEARTREIVVRAALGASRGSLVRQLILEAFALALLAGAVGILASYAGIRGLLALAPTDLPRLDEIHIDGLVLVFAVVVTTGTAFLFGLWPAWRLSRVNLQEALREGGRGMSSSPAAARMRSALVVAQCALAILLLAGAALLLRSLASLRGMDAGFRTSGVLTMRVNASRTKYPQGPQLTQFYDQLLQRTRALPGVKGAAITSDLFLSDTPNSGTFTLEDRPPFPPAEQIEATGDLVSPGFFETMQVRLVHGRFLNATDGDPKAPTLLINETFANKYWPGQDPTGRRLIFGTPSPNRPWMTIVGVVGDMRRRGLHRGARLEVFRSTALAAGRNMQLLVVTDAPPLSLVPTVRQEVRALDPSGPITQISTVDAEIGESLAVRRFQAVLLALFAGLAVLLSAVGIFGLMTQVVVRRTGEIGLRMALGATRQDVSRMVIRQGVLLAAAGGIVGIVGAFGVARLLRSLLFGIGTADPVSYVGAGAVMAVAVLLACGLPAWRAAGVDPMVALRDE